MSKCSLDTKINKKMDLEAQDSKKTKLEHIFRVRIFKIINDETTIMLVYNLNICQI